jgi:hypothetical protein
MHITALRVVCLALHHNLLMCNLSVHGPPVTGQVAHDSRSAMMSGSLLLASLHDLGLLYIHGAILSVDVACHHASTC